MSARAKNRIDPELKRRAEAVLKEIGLKPQAALELFYRQIIKRRAIPFPVRADGPEDEVLSLPARRDKLAWIAYPKAGKLGTDLNRDLLSAALAGEGVQPVRQVAIDEVWSALRFRPA